MVLREDLDKMNLPKANDKEEMETISEQKLRPLFTASKFQYCKKDEKDKGVDITYEIKKTGSHTGFRFVVQLKSTKTTQPNRTDGSIGIPIDSSNVTYLLNNNCLAFYILYDFATDTFYYESVVLFWKSLLDKNEKWDEQGSHLLKFTKKLTSEVIDTEMYDDVIKFGLLHREIKERSLLISSSVNNSDKIIVGPDFGVTDDTSIREIIESSGFYLINEGRWMEIIQLNENATGKVNSTALYNLILGIANYYGGSRWDSISFLKRANLLIHELDNEMNAQLKYFENAVKFSVGLIEQNAYLEGLSGLEQSDSIGAYIKLEKAKAEYINSIGSETGEEYDQYVHRVNEIINNPDVIVSAKLAAKCDLLFFHGSKINSDFITSAARLKGLEEKFGVDDGVRYTFGKKVEELYNAWVEESKELLRETANSKNSFAFYTTLLHVVKINYQFDVYITIMNNNDTDSERDRKKDMYEELLNRLESTRNYFTLIGHVENSIEANSLKFEIYHYRNDFSNAEKVMKELEGLVDKYDLEEQNRRAEILKNEGTTHQLFKKFIYSALRAAKSRVEAQDNEFDGLRNEMIEMDSAEKNEAKQLEDTCQIELFPIGRFQFPKTAKDKVFEIIKVSNPKVQETFNEMFENFTPIANIHYSSVEKEGYQEGKLADKGIESWRNIHRIRKAFYENEFYRLVE